MISDHVGYEEIDGDDEAGDFMGDDLQRVGDRFVGFDGDDEAGDFLGSAYRVAPKSRATASARNRAAVNALIEKRIRQGSIVRDVSPTKAREYVIGFGVESVAASGTRTITQRPQVLFRPERIIIPSNIALDFMLTDVKIGKNSQFTASAEVPAVVFAETSFGVRLKMDTCQISMDIILAVRNLSANARNFTAAIIGPAVE